MIEPIVYNRLKTLSLSVCVCLCVNQADQIITATHRDLQYTQNNDICQAAKCLLISVGLKLHGQRLHPRYRLSTFARLLSSLSCWLFRELMFRMLSLARCSSAVMSMASASILAILSTSTPVTWTCGIWNLAHVSIKFLTVYKTKLNCMTEPTLALNFKVKIYPPLFYLRTSYLSFRLTSRLV